MRRLTDDEIRLVAGGVDYTTTAPDGSVSSELIDYGSRELQGTYGWDGLTGPQLVGVPTSTQRLASDYLFYSAATLLTGVQP